ncbi:26411_t:CDS:2, partial [Racocetra persica]
MNCSDVRQEAYNCSETYNCSDVKPEQQEDVETTSFRTKIIRLQIANSKAKTEIETLISENSSLQNECNSLRLEKSENLSTINSLSEQITSLKSQSVGFQIGVNGDIEALISENSNLQKECNRLRLEKSENLSTINSLSGQVTSFKSQIVESQIGVKGDIEALISENSSLQKECNRLRLEKNENLNTINSVNEPFTFLKLQTVESQIGVKGDVETLISENSNLQKECNRLRLEK